MCLYKMKTLTFYCISSVLVVNIGAILDRNRVYSAAGVELQFKSECGPSSLCLVKCCGKGEVMYLDLKTKIPACQRLDDLQKRMDLTKYGDKLTTFSDLGFRTADKKNSSKTINDFHLLYRKDFNPKDINIVRIYTNETVLFDDGRVQIEQPPLVNTLNAPGFCFDVVVISNNNAAAKAFGYFLNKNDGTEEKHKNYYVAFGNLVSAFFILLVLGVYAALKQLRKNLNGMMTMVFLASMMVFMLLHSSTIIYEYQMEEKGLAGEADSIIGCMWLSSVTYFFNLSTFFWMNVTCFDIWWTFRYATVLSALPAWLYTPLPDELDELTEGTRKVREIHRRGILVKFLTYALYAWGIPLVLTVAAVIIDRSDVPASVVKPSFDHCMHNITNNEKHLLYKFLTMLMLVAANVVLFFMTIYNIWLVRKNMTNTELKQNKKNQNHFLIYLKLSVLMGVSWIVELVQVLAKTDDLDFWTYVALNCFNIFIGVIIFFLMVFKKSIFLMLCKRFNYENRWTRRSTNVKGTTQTDCSRIRKNDDQTKSTDDSIVIESMALSNADVKANEPALNPRFTVTKV